MSNNFWNDEGAFNDGPVEMRDGQWVQPDSAPVPQSPRRAQPQPQQATWAPVEPEQVVAQVFADQAEEDEDDLTVLSDATLRLEQGRLYQMVMNHNLFEGMDADVRAIKNVQREIRKFARERMEIMLGMRQESQTQAVVSSPFNEMEVQALKMLAGKVTGGRSEATEAAPKPPAKRDLTPISGTTKPAAPKSLPAPTPKSQASALRPEVQKLVSKPAAPIQRQAPVAPTKVPEIDAVMDGVLTKPVNEMTTDELADHNKRISAKQAGKKAQRPTDALPMPSADQEEILYSQRVASAAPAVSAIVSLMNQRK